VEYMQRLRAWCDGHQILLTCDEVQAGFGRTGTLFGFEHYGLVPDITTWGKGVSSSLPLAFVAGRPEIMDQFPAGSMTSTHTGNPVCCAAASASIDLVLNEGLVENSRVQGELLHQRLAATRQKYHQNLAAVDGRGLVAGVHCIRPGTQEPDPDLAWDIIERSMQAGVLMFSPVGFGGATVKISPPLVITREAVLESTQVFDEVVGQAIAARESRA